jgi:hypothetical protein
MLEINIFCGETPEPLIKGIASNAARERESRGKGEAFREMKTYHHTTMQ